MTAASHRATDLVSVARCEKGSLVHGGTHDRLATSDHGLYEPQISEIHDSKESR